MEVRTVKVLARLAPHFGPGLQTNEEALAGHSQGVDGPMVCLQLCCDHLKVLLNLPHMHLLVDSSIHVSLCRTTDTRVARHHVCTTKQSRHMARDMAWYRGASNLVLVVGERPHPL